MRGVFLIPGIVILFIALMVATMPRKQKPMTVAKYKQCVEDARQRAEDTIEEICGDTKPSTCYSLATEEEKKLLMAVLRGYKGNKNNCLEEFANRR